MRHPLYAELRTVYEATAENPRTFRITIKLKDMVDPDVLRHAVRKTMQRYPYFRVRLIIDENDVSFEDNPMPTPVLHTDGPIMLGGYETQSHLLAFCWWKNKVHIDVWHALTDGGGIHHLLQTFLYYYCSEYYGRELSSEGIWLADDEVAAEEWVDPMRKPMLVDPGFLVDKWHDRAFQIAGGGIARIGKRCIVYNILIPEDEFMRFNISNEGSPGTVIALFLSRAISSVHPETDDPTALPSCETLLTLELSAVNGSFYVNFMQFFEEDAYLRAFIGQLRENGINYDVLYQEQTKYPGFVCPWS